MAIGVLGPCLASSAPRNDPRAERERVRAEQATNAAQLDTSKASKAEIDDALQAITENLDAQEAALARTRQQVTQAKDDIADAENAIARLDHQIDTLKEVVRERAVSAFVSPPGDDVLTVLDSNDFVTASSRKFYIELRSQSDADVADRLDGAMAEIDFQRSEAETARKVAEQKEAEQAERTEAVRTAKAQKQKLADDLEATIDAQIAHSIELHKTDRALSRKIAQEAAAAAARLAALKSQQDAAASDAGQAAAQAPTDTQGGGGASGSGEIAPVPPSEGPGPGTGLCTVSGITVDCGIRDALGAMISDAASKGVHLSGGGYRDPAQQIALRKAHCGTSYYAIYQMPSSSCHPPTARPGSSMHEVGLAIDFDNCGYGSAAYDYLKANASRYGFYNLPSESWHWSTTGG